MELSTYSYQQPDSMTNAFYHDIILMYFVFVSSNQTPEYNILQYNYSEYESCEMEKKCVEFFIKLLIKLANDCCVMNSSSNLKFSINNNIVANNKLKITMILLICMHLTRIRLILFM